MKELISKVCDVVYLKCCVDYFRIGSASKVDLWLQEQSDCRSAAESTSAPDNISCMPLKLEHSSRWKNLSLEFIASVPLQKTQ